MSIAGTTAIIAAIIIVGVFAAVGLYHVLTFVYSRTRLWLQPYYRAPKRSLRAHFLGQVINR